MGVHQVECQFGMGIHQDKRQQRLGVDALGLDSIDQMIGKTDFDFSPPDMAARYQADDAEVMSGAQRKMVVEPHFSHGKRNWIETYKAPVHSEDGSLLGTVGFAHDISDRKQEEEAMLMRNAALAGLLRGEPTRSVLELLLLSLQYEIHGGTCAVFAFDGERNELTLTAAPSAPESWQASIARIPVGEGFGASGTAAFRQSMVMVEDMATDSLVVDYREFARVAGISNACSLPLIAPEGDLLGVLSIYRSKPGPVTEHQVALLTQSSQMLSLVMTQGKNTQRVDEALKTFRGIFDNVTEALFVQAEDGVFLDINQAAEQMFGVPASQLLGQTHEFLAAEGLNDLPAIALSIRQAAQGQAQNFEFWGRDANGQAFPCEVSLHPCSYFGRKVLIASVQDVSERKAEAQRLLIEHDLAAALVSGMQRDDLLATFLDIALRFPEFDCGGLYLREPDGSYRLAVHRGLSESFVASVAAYAPDSLPCYSADCA